MIIISIIKIINLFFLQVFSIHLPLLLLLLLLVHRHLNGFQRTRIDLHFKWIAENCYNYLEHGSTSAFLYTGWFDSCKSQGRINRNFVKLFKVAFSLHNHNNCKNFFIIMKIKCVRLKSSKVIVYRNIIA